MKAADIPYQLLGLMERDAPLLGLSEESGHSQDATAAYITTMYYSALSNLYIQSILPEDMTEVDAQMPRVKIAFERSFVDFTSAAKWLMNNSEFINASSAKQYYYEVIDLDEGVIKNMTTFYASKDQQTDTAQHSEVGVDGILKFLHYYDPQNENDDTARAFMNFLVNHKAILAAGDDSIFKELYHQFREQGGNS